MTDLIATAPNGCSRPRWPVTVTEVGVALEIAQWLGTQPEPGSATRASDARTS